jgi:hypothetical protein
MRTALLVLNAFVLGGCLALLLVWSALQRMLATPGAFGPGDGRPPDPEQLSEWLFPIYGAYSVALAVALTAGAAYWAVKHLWMERRP